MSERAGSPARLRFGARNLLVLTGALVSLTVGYVLLAAGDTAWAPVLLVLGYCVLLPLGLAL